MQSLPAFLPARLPMPSSLSQQPPLEPHKCRSKRTRNFRMSASPPPPPPPPQNNPDDEDPLSSISSRDWREFRAALIAGSVDALEKSKQTAYRKGHWAHPLALPETGCFLASHPAYYRRGAPYLTQAVVFLTSYSHAQGATGLVLNRPLSGTVREMEAKGMFGRSCHFGDTPLATQPVYAGGPDLLDSGVLTVLRGWQKGMDMSAAAQPLDGVFVGGLAEFLESVKKGVVDAADGRLFAGCLRWKKGELEREVDEGSWYCVAASPLFALKHCIQLPKPLWVEIMQSQGKPFAQIASQVYKEKEQEGEEE